MFNHTIDSSQLDENIACDQNATSKILGSGHEFLQISISFKANVFVDDGTDCLCLVMRE